MKSVKTLRPGQKGTKKWVAVYGDALLFVRYRYNEADGLRYTTVEIAVDEGVKKQERKQIAGNKLVLIRVQQNERYLQKMIKAAGARWKPGCGLWQMPFREVVALGLGKRIVLNKSVSTR